MTPGPDSVDKRLYVFIFLITLMTFGHHVDHVVRGNHVSWPVAPGISPFTFSIAIYLFYFLGLYLTLTDRVGAEYWMLLVVVGFPLLTAVHFGPFAYEPPQDVYGAYESEILGLFAFGWLLVMMGAILTAGVHSARRWRSSGGTHS